MKVGVITFHFVDNYGAMLQCAALQGALRDLGHEPRVIDFLPFAGSRDSWRRGWRHRGGLLKTACHRVFRTLAARGMIREFRRFRSHCFTLTPECRDLAQVSKICEEFDCVITGSDQVWHFERHPAYFFAWEGGRPRKISYAPSCATDAQNYGKAAEVGEWISRFSAVSVRDAASATAIRKVTGQDPVVVADPTLLWDPAPLEESAAVGEEPYLLTYVIGGTAPEPLKRALEEARRTSGVRKVIAIVAPSHNLRRPVEADESIWSASPGRWLSLIKNARLLVTDSFHGCLFALRYRTPFVAFYTEAIRAPRLVDLAQRYHLADHVVSLEHLADRLKSTVSCGSPESHELISTHVTASKDFLRLAVAGEIKEMAGRAP